MSFYQTVAPTRNANDVHPDLLQHFDAVSAHVPSLGAAMADGHVVFSAFQAGVSDMPAVMDVLIDAAEDVRTRRRTYGDLASAVVAVDGLESDYAAHLLLDIPQWIGVNLYAPVGLAVHLAVVGESYEAEPAVPPVPVSFFMVHPMSEQDVEILSEEDGFRHLTPTTADDGRDVLRPITDLPASGTAVKPSLRRLLWAFPTPHECHCGSARHAAPLVTAGA